MRRPSALRSTLLRGWGRPNWLSYALLPASGAYAAVSAARRGLYRLGWLKAERLPVPVIVVGNLSVGGTGKTPLAVYLVELLRRHGYRPGVISRGYLGRATDWPQLVGNSSDPALVGDEPAMIAGRAGCPVAAGPSRLDSGRALLASAEVDVIVSDDGLQHYALHRDVEIALVDDPGENRCLLPSGPYREPATRLRQVDLIVHRRAGNEHHLALSLCPPVRVDGVQGELEAHARVHAVAGISRPERFFEQLTAAGWSVIEHPFPDHHRYCPAELNFGDELPVLMTEKDAVKCRAFAEPNYWCVRADARLDDAFDAALLALLPARTPVEPDAINPETRHA